MDIFEFNNYRLFLKSKIESFPKNGYGQAKKLAHAIGVSTTLISHILNEQRDLTLEQAYLTSEFFGLTDLEIKYFLNMVQLERAGNPNLRKYLTKEVDHIKKESQKISSRLQYQKILTDEQRGIFYSDWYYSAIRLLTSISQYDSVDTISQHLGLPRKHVRDTVSFLIQSGLILDTKGKLTIGPLSTHLDPDSPWIRLHHANWRNKALENMRNSNPSNLHYSSPMTLAKKDIEKIRVKLVKMIEEVGQIVDPSPPEELMCINIDWFKI